MRITLDIPDKYADVLAVTCIAKGLSVFVRAVDLTGREGQTLKLYDKGGFAHHIWLKGDESK